MAIHEARMQVQNLSFFDSNLFPPISAKENVCPETNMTTLMRLPQSPSSLFIIMNSLLLSIIHFLLIGLHVTTARLDSQWLLQWLNTSFKMFHSLVL